MTHPPPVLLAEDVQKSFPLPDGKSLQVLRGVDLALLPGESVSIRGESGSGKSTLLNCLAGLERADAGNITWQTDQPIDVPATSLGRLARIRAGFLGFVFQSHYLVPECHALENVLLPMRFLPGGLDRPRARALLARVGLAEREKSRIETLSGGERQRVALARALVNRPRLVLADEPTGNLDEKTSEAVMALLLEACKEEGASLILVTHHPAFAQRTDRALFLTHGALAP